MTKYKLILAGLLVGCFSLCSSAFALTIQIDLNDFYQDPNVIVSGDGSTATIEGDGLLSNDPFYGDPGIAVPADLLSLSFDYSFTEGAGNDDDFYAWVFDGDTGTFIDELWVDFSDTGTVDWNLSGLDPSTTLLGMEFQITEYGAVPAVPFTASIVTISNVHLTTEAAPVPEPTTMLLVGTGLAGLIGTVRKKRSKESV